MKRRRPDIPDFAPKRPHNQQLDKLAPQQKVKPPVARQPAIKPQATAAKGNRRGG